MLTYLKVNIQLTPYYTFARIILEFYQENFKKMLRLLYLITILLTNITCICGQIVLVNQPVEGYKGDGQVIAYSNNRILLKLSKDGNWPRQIIWKVKTGKGPSCFVTFNSSGWNYTPSRDTCGLDWALVKSQIIESQLFVSNIGTSSQTNSYSTLNESFRQIALQRSDSINLLMSFIVDTSIDAKNSIVLDSSSLRNKSLESQLMKAPSNPLRNGETPSEVTISVEESMKQLINSDKNIPNQFDSTHVLNTSKYKIYKDLKSHRKDTVLSTLLLQYSTKDSSMEIQQNNNNLLKSLSSESKKKINRPGLKSENFENKDTTNKSSTFGVKNKDVLIKTTLESMELDRPVKQTPDDLKNEKSTLPIVNLSPTENNLPNAPFISVASFRTLTYTKSVIHLFDCPGGCKIVRSSKEDYYRIGFYPLENTIYIELMNIRKIYPDAWLVK